MPELQEVLERLGLSQYLSSLVDNGFESWETVLDINEDDLRELGFKIGHRRSLQREIASYRGIPATQTLLSDIETPRADSSSPLPSSIAGLDAFPFPAQPPTPSKASQSSKEGKRRYRRHPKPDQHAPKKPRTAYVNFADNLRLDPAVSSLSFVDIAREVGRRWQTLPPDEKHRWECAAARAMQEYEMQMEEYKKTDLHQRYQEYLDDFRRKQQLAKDRKNEKHDHEERPGSKHDHDYPDRADSGSPMSLGSVATPEMDKYNESMNIAMKDLESMRQEVLSSGIQLFDAYNMPPEEIVRGSALSFLSSASSSIFAWPMEQVHLLLSRLYDRNRRPDPMTMAEGFVLAALGGYFNPSNYGVNDMMRKTLHASATALFNHDVPSRSGYLRSMRLFLCLSYYSTLEKHLSGRQLACAGLQLARWKHPEFSRLPDGDTWRRVYRTLVFLDAWISSTLGFPASTTAEDVSNVCNLGLAQNSASDAIQYYSTSIMVIGAEISNVLRVPENCTPENVKHSLTKIDHWNRNLHPIMQLPNITSSPAPLSMDHHHRQAAIMVHILYLTTIIQLYAHLLSASTSPAIQASWTPAFLAEIRSCHRHTASAAAQIAHLLSLLNASPGDQRRRWWLRIHASYTAGVALLYASGMKMLNAEEAVGVAGGAVQAAERVDEDLRLARECLDSLSMSASCDPAAGHLLNLLRPLYNTLDLVLGRSTSASTASSPRISLGAPATPGARGKSSIYALLDDGLNVRGPSPPRPTGNLSRLELLPAVDLLGGLLRDPSGRLREGWIGGEWVA